MNKSKNTSDQFDQRKKDHISISLKDSSQSLDDQLSQISFRHNALPEIDFQAVSLTTQAFGSALSSPLFVSSMTLGHDEAGELNNRIAYCCDQKGWMMGVGSQRRQLFDPQAYQECEKLRARFPNLILFGNIGLSQVITSTVAQLQTLVESLGAQFLVVHTNPLQEAIQPEGTPQFSGGLQALSRLCHELSVPVVLKETGCGFSEQNFQSLKDISLAAVDVSGKGGTHWGRVEGLRQSEEEMGYQVAQTFADWGLSTVDSLENAYDAEFNKPIWASGGVRSGLDAAKLIALGAEKVGFARPILQKAVQGEEHLLKLMERLDRELKVALFCLGIDNVESLVGKRNHLQWK
ncbi:MAG: type 2 isopentenyl-diphosphate Delta-isomerase [Pseudomonadota bacterium]